MIVSRRLVKALNSTYCTRTPRNLYGRDVLSLSNLTGNEIKSLLWTALEIKKLKSPTSVGLLNSSHISLIFVKPNARAQISFERAASKLGCTSTFYSDPVWDEQPDITDSGRLLSKLTDAVVVAGLDDRSLVKLADGSTVPVINAYSNHCCLVKALADTMTLLEALGPLRRKTLAWVGPPSSLCNSYLTLLPKLGISLRICCICSQGSGLMSALKMEEGLLLCRGQAEIHQCSTAEEAVYRADIICTERHSSSAYQINLKILEEAALKWYFLHGLPRSSVEVTDDVHRHTNNLTWKSIENTQFIAMALLAQTLGCFQPTTSMPDFDGPP